MPPRNGVAKRGNPRRRKIALACEACREKKVRCDGQKPICGPCARRSYTIDRCVYKLDNARSASNDEYLKILHNRIQELEEACSQGGVGIPPASLDDPEEGGTGLDHVEEQSAALHAGDAESRTSVAVEGLLGLGSTPGLSGQDQSPATPSQISYPAHRSRPSFLSSRSHAEGAEPHSGDLVHYNPAQSRTTNAYQSPSLNSHGHVTAMGAISVAEDGEGTDSPQEPYYGNSSAASFMRLAKYSMPVRSYMQALQRSKNNPICSETGLWQDLKTDSSDFQFADFSLPPRPLADHLLECYWDRVYCLYPFFHRPSFEQAYENLWGSSKWPKPGLPELNIGLGGAYDSGPDSIVFHCALNAIFGLACHFSDIPAAERETTAYTFFLRSKRFIGLDMLDIGTIGVVQTFLIVALLLQSTPYPNRCWNSIGVACRVAQGLGLHETATQISIKPLEKEIRRRTWHGCVIMDMIVSMTFGRPSMTSHISPVPLPAMGSEPKSEDPCALSGQPCDHRLGYMTFYVSTIKLYKILESILSDIYNAWQSRSNSNRPTSPRETRPGSLDVLMELDDKLSLYEASVPHMLNWTNARPRLGAGCHQGSIFERQKNVLRARFIHLRLLLYRPMFSQLCSNERISTSRRAGPDSRDRPGSPRVEPNIIYSSVSSKCAAACVMAAVDLVSLVHMTYQTTATDAWWYNGFYTSTAGFILIMSYSCRAILDQIDIRAVDDTWRKCEEILGYMASFSLSARNSLQFLQVTHQHIAQHYSGTSRSDHPAPAPNQSQQRTSCHSSRPGFATQPADVVSDDPSPEYSDPGGPSVNPFMSWDELGLGQEEFGFLGKFDLPDLASWFADVPP
ncbi:hypothetical protein NUU61_008790 [Penicillium alfredii]|uniref:Zn(2)-C6 fungal-type domain-containing protein n=1 Tax=Penicillium alfredii TaxID=1506179 RepID=A0A9W9JWR0_9EURO|nr:uncharacterized protein NUU61_008790 [Penicillium alfredii]KAJ5084211.1 hypothetical protein NUU61_008790 [Penicillium alfredii]